MPKTSIKRNNGPLTFPLADILAPIAKKLRAQRIERTMQARKREADAFMQNAQRKTKNARAREQRRAKAGVGVAAQVAALLGAKVA